jgi:uncharacterized membrane protein YphA (DoxX/SURF4 family)
MKLFVLVARLLLGGLFFGDGTQKLFGWFGGHGLDGTAGFFESLACVPAASTPWSPARPKQAVARCSPPGLPLQPGRRR